MKEYELTDKDYAAIYEQAVREFNHNGVQYKQTYNNFLTRCIMKSAIALLAAKNIEVKEGKLYVSKKDD